VELKKIILRKLFRRRIIGGKHTAIEHLTKGLPKQLRGDAKDAIHSLITDGLLLPKPTSYGLQVSLNPERLHDISRIVEE